MYQIKENDKGLFSGILALVSLRPVCSLPESFTAVMRFVPLECGKVLTGWGNSIRLRGDKKTYVQSSTFNTFIGMKRR
jgi:hypothetical protein